MNNLRLSHVNLRVEKSNLDAMKDFYQEILNLKVGPRPNFGTIGYWLYSEEKPIVHLSIFKNDISDEELKTYNGGYLDHIAFDFCGGTNIEQTLREKEITYKKVIWQEERICQIFIKDPVGTTIELTVHEV